MHFVNNFLKRTAQAAKSVQTAVNPDSVSAAEAQFLKWIDHAPADRQPHLREVLGRVISKVNSSEGPVPLTDINALVQGLTHNHTVQPQDMVDSLKTLNRHAESRRGIVSGKVLHG